MSKLLALLFNRTTNKCTLHGDYNDYPVICVGANTLTNRYQVCFYDTALECERTLWVSGERLSLR